MFMQPVLIASFARTPLTVHSASISSIFQAAVSGALAKAGLEEVEVGAIVCGRKFVVDDSHKRLIENAVSYSVSDSKLSCSAACIAALFESLNFPVSVAVAGESYSTAPWILSQDQGGEMALNRLRDVAPVEKQLVEYRLLSQRRFAAAVSDQRMQKELVALNGIQKDKIPEISSIQEAVGKTGTRTPELDWGAAVVFSRPEFAKKEKIPGLGRVIGYGRATDAKSAVSAACRAAGKPLSYADFFQISGEHVMEISSRLKLPVDRVNLDGMTNSGISSLGRVARLVHEKGANAGLSVVEDAGGAVAFLIESCRS